VIALSGCTPATPDTDIVAEPELTRVDIVTDFGTMEAVLYDTTPAHRDNFIKLAEE
jgi:hypothetical protein